METKETRQLSLRNEVRRLVLEERLSMKQASSRTGFSLGKV
jgi:hypothetical protein